MCQRSVGQGKCPHFVDSWDEWWRGDWLNGKLDNPMQKVRCLDEFGKLLISSHWPVFHSIALETCCDTVSINSATTNDVLSVRTSQLEKLFGLEQGNKSIQLRPAISPKQANLERRASIETIFITQIGCILV